MYDSDEEIEETPKWKGIAGTIYVANFYDPANTGAPSVMMRNIKQTIRLNMRNADSRVVGVCLCATKNPLASGLALQSVTEILPLAVPSLESYQKLKDFNETSYEQASELKLSEVFWHCSRMFTNCKKLLSERTVMFLTRLDTPPIQQDRRPTLKRVVDLMNLGIELKVINISKEPYNVDEYYLELIRASKRNSDEIDIPKPLWGTQDILSILQQRSHRHLASSRLKFLIGDGFEISVGIYNLVRPKPMPKTVKLDSESNEIVTSNIKLMKTTVEDSGSNMEVDEVNSESANQNKNVPMLKSELLYYQVYGNEKIEFTPEEMTQLKNPFGNPCIKLLGFKPKQVLKKEQWFLKQCALLFPTESIVEGSTKVFKALHKACLEKSVIAICMLCSRVNSKPKIVALSPCINPVGLKIDVGFDIIYIPYLENVKEIPEFEEHEFEIGAQEKDVMKDIIQKLSFDYKATSFENPKLQFLYRAIEALALQEESLENYADTTKPLFSKFENINAQLFENMFGPLNPSSTKRPHSGNNEREPKRQAENLDIDEELLQNRLQIKHINKYNVADLKKILKWKSPPDLPALTGKKKDELVELVYHYCE